MAENKKSFLLYCDLIHTVNKLPNETAGKLFKHLLSYVNDEEPETDDLLVEVSFEPIKQQLKRDLKKYEKIKEKRSEAGKLSAEARRNKRQQNEQVLTSVKSAEQTSTNSTVSVNDNVNVSVSVNDNVKVNDINNNKVYSYEVNECFNDCLTFFENHLHPKTEKQKNSWLDTIDKLNRIDQIPFELIVQVVMKTRNNDFWSKNFLSLPKLRKKNKDGLLWIVYFNEKFKTKQKSTVAVKASDFDENGNFL